MNRAAAVVLMALIRTYQAVISPWVTQQCKYYPSCSAYGLEAVRRHGAVRGTRLTVWRILRCNPWSDGGVDHVPPRHDDPLASAGPITPGPVTADSITPGPITAGPITAGPTTAGPTSTGTVDTQPTTGTPVAPAPSDLART